MAAGETRNTDKKTSQIVYFIITEALNTYRLSSTPLPEEIIHASLEEKGYGREQLNEVRQLIDAEKSDLYDVLAYIAFAFAPITRAERVNNHKKRIFDRYADKQLKFLSRSFVLDHYISQGVGELDQEKLPGLLELKYHSVGDAVAELGSVAEIRDMFFGFQEHLYVPTAVA